MTNFEEIFGSLEIKNDDVPVPEPIDVDLDEFARRGRRGGRGRGRRGGRRRPRRPVVIIPPRRRRRRFVLYPPFRVVYPRRRVLLPFFGFGLGALTALTISELSRSYDEREDARVESEGGERDKFIPCDKLPKGIEITKDEDGNAACAEAKDGLVCFYEIKKGEPKACFVRSE